MTAIRILLVIADPGTREKFRGLLQQQEGEMDVTGEASAASAGLELAEKLRPDLILMDLDLLREVRFDRIQQLKKGASPAKILVLRARVSLQDPLFLRELMHSGAAGVIETGETPERILQTIRQTAAGDDTLMNMLVNLAHQYQAGAFGRSTDEALHAFGLTPREADVLQLVLTGKTDQNIGVLLGISENTVMKYKYAIYTKLMGGSAFKPNAN